MQEATEAIVAKLIEETKGLVTCTRLELGRNFRLQFVKCEDIDPRATYNDISSTILREVMTTKKGVKLREALDWMALSADLLWRCRSSWIDKARSDKGCFINFQESMEELRQPGPPCSYEKPPHFDDPPSFEKLSRVHLRVSRLLSSIKRSAQPEAYTCQDNPPNYEEPQPLGDLPPINTKKRRFSVTGLEEDVDLSVVAQCTETQKPGSCRF